MPLIHIVLFKIKADIWEAGNGKDELIQKFEALKETSVVKDLCQEISFGPPAYPERAQGWTYGLYTKFENKAAYEVYRDHQEHKDFVMGTVRPNTDSVMAYDWEY